MAGERVSLHPPNQKYSSRQNGFIEAPDAVIYILKTASIEQLWDLTKSQFFDLRNTNFLIEWSTLVVDISIAKWNFIILMKPMFCLRQVEYQSTITLQDMQGSFYILGIGEVECTTIHLLWPFIGPTVTWATCLPIIAYYHNV